MVCFAKLFTLMESEWFEKYLITHPVMKTTMITKYLVVLISAIA